jgi:hypothetical protein
MPNAQVRAQLPQAFPLSPAEISALGMGGIHHVTLREAEEFVPQVEIHPLPDMAHSNGRIVVGAVTAMRIENGIHLQYRHSALTGAPDRSHRPPIEFDIAAPRRARVAYNGRFSGYGIEWLYKLSVITVAVGIAPGAGIFTTAPDHRVEDLADLF